jgi:hypothetical protein
MSVKIDLQKFRKAFGVWDDFHGTLPLYRMGTVEYDGEYVRLDNPSGSYNAWRTGISYTRVQYGTPMRGALDFRGKGYATDDTSIYFFFLEPAKGDYSNYQGFRHDGANYCVESRSGGIETQTNLTGQDWKVETEFRIHYRTDEARFYINGSLVVTHTTDLSSPPFEVHFGEPNGVARTVFLRYPPGIYLNP